jgi:hypothetical protein
VGAEEFVNLEYGGVEKPHLVLHEKATAFSTVFELKI